ncbi:pitrilysin [Aliidiomarina iranensis]|uniref:Protease 3 n=1 Tax=Aliidiomarina iranensis TaxID=1434071 RepID=A0A432W2E4_9GAMM|nr:pitrilysin [Aliidiomarina iranensis]RUO23412.1 pitrilysin [Aliidiomarina iranensis]
MFVRNTATYVSKTIRAGAILVSATLLLAACQPAPEPAPEQADVDPMMIYTSPNDTREYRALELENGLRIVLVSDSEAEKSGAALAVFAGSMQNPDDQLGLAHYLEHMLFLGTEKYPDPDEYGDFMAQNGGMHNAYTADDHTNYMLEVNNDALPEALDRFADFFKAPKFYPEYAEKEVNAVDSEWSMRRASDGYILFSLNNILMNPEHPIARFRIGNSETLSDKENSNLHEEMLAFYEQYYSANLMTASIVSNRPLDELEALARAAFADIPNHDAEVPQISVPVATAEELQKKIFYKPQMELRQVMLDFTIENNMDEYLAKPNRLVAHLINSEMPGTPAALFRELGWIENLGAGASANAYGNAGRFQIAATLTEAGMAHRETIIGVLLQYIEQIRAEGVAEKYHGELATVLSNEFTFLRRMGAFDYATSLASNLLYYPFNHVIDHAYRLEDYDAAKVDSVLAQLTPENLRVWYVSPQEETDETMYYFDGNYRVAEISEEDFANWETAAQDYVVSLPSANTLFPEDLSLVAEEVHGKPQQLLDEPGISVWLKRSDRFAEPRAEVTVRMFQPTFERSIEEQIAVQVLMDTFGLSQQALAREASIAGTGFGLSASNGLTLRLTGFNDKQMQLAERVLTSFAEFEPASNAIAQSVDRLRRSIQNQRLQFPMQQLFPAFNQIMRLPSVSYQDQLAALSVVDQELVIAMRDQLLQGNTIRTFAFGNYSDAEAVALTRKVAEIAKVDPEVEYRSAPIVEPTDALRLTWNDNLTLEDTAILDVWLSPEDTLEARAKAWVLSELMHNRFFTELRTEDQLGYAVGATRINLDDYSGVGFYIQSPVRGPAALLARFDKFRADYAERLADLTEEDFAQVRTSALTDLLQPPQTLGQEAGRYSADWADERYSFDTQERTAEALRSLSLADIQAFYQTLISNGEGSRVLIQMRGTKFAEEAFGSMENERVIEDFTSWSESQQ